MNLRAIRKQLGMTLKKVANRAGISECYLCMVETGKKKPGVKTAKKLACIYGVNWTDFFNEEEKKCKKGA